VTAEAGPLGDLRRALDALPALAWIYTPDRRLLYANRAMREYFGPEGLDDEAWIDVVHPGDRDRASAEWHAPAIDAEYRLRRRDGEWRRALVRARALRGDDGALLAWIGTTTDVEDERRMGDEFRRQALDIGLVLAAAGDAAERERARLAKVVRDTALEPLETAARRLALEDHAELSELVAGSLEALRDALEADQ
jgi:PAS domain S-box-containing protein